MLREPQTQVPTSKAPAAARLLDLDPTLAEGIADEELLEARARALVPVVTLNAGPVAFARLRRPEDPLGPFAVLVSDGLIARDVSLFGRPATQLVGPGDVLTIPDRGDLSEPARMTVGCATRVRVAVLERRFLAAVQQWPWLAARLIERAGAWSDRALSQQAINQLGRVDLRLMFMLGHLAERWGRVTPDGVFVPLRLTHETLGRLVGAQRSTVTLALKELREQGAVVKHGDGYLLAHGAGGELPVETVGDPTHKSLAVARGAHHAVLGGEHAAVDVTLEEHLGRVRENAAAARAKARRAREESARRRAGDSALRFQHEDLEGARRAEEDLAVVGENAAA
jgi:CRP/FNR family transcriptional regulator, cyclic AMP receptor protein